MTETPVPSPQQTPAVDVAGLSHSYGSRTALDSVGFQVARGEFFGVLGPNGGGKTTLFRILATLFPPASGTARILGLDIRGDSAALRRRLGVVFQSPALDAQLTVAENLRHQGRLHGFSGRNLGERIEGAVERFGLGDRRKDLVRNLSGGLKRRVELARALLTDPEVLLLDEPTTGLDPVARREFWSYLTELRRNAGLTILLTTHLLDEADPCDRVGILDRGKLVALDRPDAIKSGVGGDVVSVTGNDPDRLLADIRTRFGADARLVDGVVRIEREKGHAFVPELVEAFSGRILSVTVARPTLEDAFIRLTGRGFA